MIEPIVSVIIPTYRRWGMLAEALESLQRQTLQNWQAVVVNDAGGEPDENTRLLLQDHRVRYIQHTENRGPAAARNTGIANSNGKYIAYLDDDDIYYPQHLELLVGELIKGKDNVVFSNSVKGFYAVCGDGTRLVSSIEKTRSFCRNRMWRANFMSVQSIVHSRICLEKTGLFDESLRLMEDWDLWLRMSCLFHFRHIQQFTSEYRVRLDSSNATNSQTASEWLSARCRIYVKYLEWPLVKGDIHLYTLLRSNISHFVRNHFPWLVEKFMHEQDNHLWRELLLATNKLTWLRIGLRNPIIVMKTRNLLRLSLEQG
jgi:glycosyltransferase involved in cell wall biosynthesis